MSKKRVHEIAKEFGVESKQVISILQQHNINVTKAVNSVDDSGYEIVKKQLGKKSEAPKVAQKKEKKVESKSAPTVAHKQEAASHKQQHSNRSNEQKKDKHKQAGQKQDDQSKQKDHKKGNVRHVQISEPTRKSDGKQHGGDRANNRPNNTRNNDNRNNGRSNDVRNNDSRNNDNRNSDNRNNDNRNSNNDRRNKKNKKGGNNRPQSLLSTSMQKKKNRVKHRNEQYLQQKAEAERKAEAAIATEIELSGPLTVKDLAEKMGREVSEIIKKLMLLGVMASINQEVDVDTATIVAEEFGVTVTEVEPEEDPTDVIEIEDAPETLKPRPPVVTIMGHVDHGKTTLLDTLRNSRVATGEAGGITQHIGAYQIVEGGKKITFLDTPGHAAFTSMRARGASVTDITILVVAADDGVMPQTIEAINHSKAANVPIIVAINKIDKPGANPERVIGELAEHGVMSTAWGGDSEFVEISAKFNQNIDELLETVLLVAEIQELKADPTVRAIGTVIEARLDKGKGAVATLLVQQGTLNVQDPIVVGNTFGRVRAMTNDLGRRVKVAGPSTPVSITGLNETPMAGDHFAVYEDEKAARAAGEERAKRALLKQRQATHRVSLENLFDTLKAGEVKSVNVIIKADVQGSVEALAASLQKIEVEGVKVTIVHSAVGAINESDVTLAEASNAVIIGFNVRPTPQARQQAESDSVEIRLHSIIYKVIEEVEDAMKGMLDPEYQEKIIGEALIRETFKVSKVGTIGGFMVVSGKVTRDSKVRVIRDGVVIYDGQLASLKHFKDDVKEVTNGREGGLMIEGYNDIQVDDTIEAYIMEEIKK